MPASGAVSPAQTNSRPSTPIHHHHHHHQLSIIKLALTQTKESLAGYANNRFFKSLVHKETIFVATLLLVVVSTFFMAWSAILANSQSNSLLLHGITSDPNFFGNISQTILSNLSIYLVITSAIHKRSGGLRYQFWFWFFFGASFVSSLLGLGLYFLVPVASVICLWAAAFAQVIVPVLIMIKTGPQESDNGEDLEHRTSTNIVE